MGLQRENWYIIGDTNAMAHDQYLPMFLRAEKCYLGAGVKAGSGSENGSRSDIFKSSQFGSESRSDFFKNHYFLYFDTYMSTKTCRMMKYI